MPYLVDVYNEKLSMLHASHRAFREAKNRFIDTNKVVGVVWDTANDFNHLGEKAGVAEAIYILDEISKRSNSLADKVDVENTPNDTQLNVFILDRIEEHVSIAGQHCGAAHQKQLMMPNENIILLQTIVLFMVASIVLVLTQPIFRKTRTLRRRLGNLSA
jgi:hypothetical protein